MNGRERIEAAFLRDGTPEIPAAICYEGIFVRDHWAELCSEPWWMQCVPDLDLQVSWRGQVAAAIDQDWLDLPLGASYVERFYISVEERDGEVVIRDARTGLERPLDSPSIGGWPGCGLAPVHPERPPQTPFEVDLAIGEPVMVDEELAAGRADLPQRILSDWGASLYPFAYVAAPLWRCYYIWGFEGMMLQIVDQPQLVRYAVESFLEDALQRVHLFARFGASGIWIEDCLTDMIGPDQYESLNLPYLRRLTSEIRSLGMQSIYYYCGNPSGKWDLILDTGADAFSLEESKKGFVIDIEDIVDRVRGRKTVLGNLDAIQVLQNGTEEELRAEIARQIEAGRRNRSRFIMGIGSPVTPATPASRVRLYCDLVHELGKEQA
jgi:hypothetical protein